MCALDFSLLRLIHGIELPCCLGCAQFDACYGAIWSIFNLKFWQHNVLLILVNDVQYHLSNSECET